MSRRKQQAVMQLVMGIRRVLRPVLPAKRVQVRERCAERLAHFLSAMDNASAAATAVRMFRARVDTIQR